MDNNTIKVLRFDKPLKEMQMEIYIDGECQPYLRKELVPHLIGNSLETVTTSVPDGLKETIIPEQEIVGHAILEESEPLVKLLTLTQANDYWYYYSQKGNYLAFRLIMILPSMFGVSNPIKASEEINDEEIYDMWRKRYNIKPLEQKTKSLSTQLSPEMKVKLALQKREGGQVEVYTGFGFIDLLKEDEVIEIKEISQWKSAIGQVMAYGTTFPDRKKRIHLFGQCNEKTKSAIIKKCKELSIILTFEE